MTRRVITVAAILAALAVWASPVTATVTVNVGFDGLGQSNPIVFTDSQQITLSASPPAGISASFSPSSGSGDWSSIMFVDASGMAPGQHSFPIFLTPQGGSPFAFDTAVINVPTPTTTTSSTTTTTTTTVPATTTTTTTVPATTTTTRPRPTTTTTSTTTTTTVPETTTSSSTSTTTTTEPATTTTTTVETSSTQLTTSTTTTTLEVLGAQLTTSTTLAAVAPPPVGDPSSPWTLALVGVGVAVLATGLGIGIPLVRRRRDVAIAPVRLQSHRRSIEYVRRRGPAVPRPEDLGTPPSGGPDGGGESPA